MNIFAPYCAAPITTTKIPKLKLPNNSCDTHIHVFGPEKHYPYQDERSYTPRDCGPEKIFRLHDKLNVKRAVIVQASVHGTDNRAILDMVKLSPKKLRAVASVNQNITDKEIEDLHLQGVRGIRVNLVDKGGMPFDSMNEIIKISQRISDLGWHIEFLVHVEDKSINLIKLLDNLHVPSVVGHFGYTKTLKGLEDDGYKNFLSFIKDGKCWIKLTGPYRISQEKNLPYSDVFPFASKLVENAPDRLLWGSDWPHVMQKNKMPNDADLLDLLDDWIPDKLIQKKVLVDNPAYLYGF
jgi:2-pyrone-4,6-dicarboxylate lactonase